MSFLTDGIGDTMRECLSKFSNKANNYYAWLDYYRTVLTEKTIKRYEYDTNNTILSKEIELRLITLGMCGINPVRVSRKSEEKVLTACDVTLNGITQYYDEFTHYNYTSPLDSGKKKIGVDGVLMRANSLRFPIFTIINRYAMMLAHIETTLACVLINRRDSKVFTAKTTAQSEAIKVYYSALYKGSTTSIVDKQMQGIDMLDFSGTGSLGLAELEQLKRDILDDFYRSIGIPTVHVKKERMITDEIEYDNVMPQIDIKDEFENRKTGIMEVNKMFGTNFSVKCVVPYENEKEVVSNGEN